MHLINDYYLNTDRYNYIITKRSIIDSGALKGTERFTDIAYFGNSLVALKKGLMKIYILENINNQDMNKLISGIDILIDKLEGIR